MRISNRVFGRTVRGAVTDLSTISERVSTRVDANLYVLFGNLGLTSRPSRSESRNHKTGIYDNLGLAAFARRGGFVQFLQRFGPSIAAAGVLEDTISDTALASVIAYVADSAKFCAKMVPFFTDFEYRFCQNCPQSPPSFCTISVPFCMKAQWFSAILERFLHQKHLYVWRQFAPNCAEMHSTN